MKKSISAFLILLVLLTSVPALALTPESGMIGDSLTWKIKNHVLTIMGEGDMPNWKSAVSVPPWYNRGNVMAVEIKNGVTTIGNGAFSGLMNLTSADIADSVTSIGNYAFDTCINLTDITIPDGVLYIGDYAFNSCESIKNIKIPDSVNYICTNAFRYCKMLENIRISGRVTSIADYAFANCYSLKDINIPNGVKYIGYDAFSDCKSLEGTSIPASVTAIGWYAFSGCGSLTDVYYGGSEEKWDTIKIGAGNECLKNAQIHYNSIIEEEKTEIKILSVTVTGTDVSLRINDDKVDFPDAKPFIDDNDRTQIPIRAVAEMLDSEIKWDSEGKTAEITSKNGDIITLAVDSDIMTVNSENVKMDTAAIIKESRTYIPVRFVAEAMGLIVEWK